MSRKVVWAALRLMLAVLMLTAQSVFAGRISVQDDAGVEVSVASPVLRVVSLAPNATELLFAAGAGERVVGVVAGSDWPPAARDLPRIGDVHGLDLERIIALHPDLVVTWPYTTPGHVAVLRAQGIPVFIVDPRSVDEIASDVQRLGALAGTETIARAAAAALERRFAALRDRYQGRPAISVFYEVWNAPLVTLGGDHLVSRAIETCGGRNVFASVRLPAPHVTIESVLALKPEAIVAGADAGRRPKWLDDWKRWTLIPAITYGNLAVVNADLLHRPGPRFVDGMAELCEVLDRARINRDRAASPH